MTQSATRDVHRGGNKFLVLAAFVWEIQGDIASQRLRKLAAFDFFFKAGKMIDPLMPEKSDSVEGALEKSCQFLIKTKKNMLVV